MSRPGDGMTLERACGFVCAVIVAVIFLAFPAEAFPWWLRTVLVLFTGVTMCMLMNVRIPGRKRP